MPKSLTETLDDKDFRALSPDAQKIVLGHYGVSADIQGKLLDKISAKPAAVNPPPGPGFLERFNERMGSTFRALGHPQQAAQGISDALNPEKHPQGRLHDFLKQYEDPANVAADVTSGFILHTAGAGPSEETPKPKAAVAEAPKPKTGLPEPPLAPEQQAKYTEQLDKANKDFAEDTTKYQKKVADAATERKRGFAGESGGPQFEAEKATNRKAVLNRSSLEHTRLAHDNLQQTYKAARGALDQRWGEFRKTMEGAELDPVETFNDIEAAKAKYLKGSPASLQVFNNLAREMGIQEFMEGEGGGLKAIPGQGKLPFDTARIHYSAIGDRLSQGDLPGNVYQALKSVSDKLDARLTTAADTRGAGQEYSTLKAGEHQFRSDWTDSKSPLAKAFKAQDPNFLQGHLTGKGSDLLMQQLARYRKFGAKPYLTAAARRLDAEASAIKVPKAGEPKPLTAKKPTLAEVKKPTPKVAEPETPKAGKFAKHAGRIAGKVVGGTIGGTLGHPLLGYSIGGELGTEAAERLARRRSGMPPPPE